MRRRRFVEEWEMDATLKNLDQDVANAIKVSVMFGCVVKLNFPHMTILVTWEVDYLAVVSAVLSWVNNSYSGKPGHGLIWWTATSEDVLPLRQKYYDIINLS